MTRPTRHFLNPLSLALLAVNVILELYKLFKEKK